jgi:hypothetical protein
MLFSSLCIGVLIAPAALTAQRAGNAAVTYQPRPCQAQALFCHLPEKKVLTNSAGSLEFAPLLQRGDFFGSHQREQRRHNRRTR